MSKYDFLLNQSPVPEDHYRYGVATQENPLRVQLDGDTAPVDVKPTIIGMSVNTGERVLVLIHNRQMIVMGRVINGTTVMDDTTNLDTLLLSGSYYIFGSASTSISRGYPVASAGYLNVNALTAGYIEQIYTEWSGTGGIPRRFIRHRYAGTWRPWSLIETWTEWETLSLSNGYTTTTGGDALMFRQSAKKVELRGTVTPGTLNTAIATLPTSARPSQVRWLKPTAWTSQTTAWRVNINTNGTIASLSLSSGVSWISFDGESFAL